MVRQDDAVETPPKDMTGVSGIVILLQQSARLAYVTLKSPPEVAFQP
jgi:hypothetical protein